MTPNRALLIVLSPFLVLLILWAGHQIAHLDWLDRPGIVCYEDGSCVDPVTEESWCSADELCDD